MGSDSEIQTTELQTTECSKEFFCVCEDGRTISLWCRKLTGDK